MHFQIYLEINISPSCISVPSYFIPLYLNGLVNPAFRRAFICCACERHGATVSVTTASNRATAQQAAFELRFDQFCVD